MHTKLLRSALATYSRMRHIAAVTSWNGCVTVGQLAGTGVTANCLHPGFVATRFGNQTGGLISFSLRIAKRFALSPQQGADTLVYLASSPEVANVMGEYFYKCGPTAPSRDAQDDLTAHGLWAESIRLARLN